MRDDNTEPRDNQQMADDNQQAGTSVSAGQTSGDAHQPVNVGHEQDTPNQASNKEQAEGSRENTQAREGEQGPLV
jgi:hypothetical protein